MTKAFSKKTLHTEVKKVFQDREVLSNLTKESDLPENLTIWLSKLFLLKGIPFNYLVPDESMLPEESIRFFYMDTNWLDALIDGAFSVGRNLTNEDSYEHMQDLVFTTKLKPSILENISQNLVNDFKEPVPPQNNTISGFLIRSSIVKEYPNMGVNAYPKGHSPSDSADLKLLPIVRYERLGKSDVMICLIQGDAYQIDIHEAPEVLHLGIDCFNNNCQVNSIDVNAVKNIRTFSFSTSTSGSITTNKVTFSGNSVPTDISSSFRTNSPRVLNMTTLASTIVNTNKIEDPSITSINSAEMGFVMTEGVGTASFIFKQQK